MNTFNPSGNRTRLDDSLDGYVTTTYDLANRPTQINQAGTGVTPKQVNLSYNTRGEFASIARSQNGTIVTQASYTYDSAGRLSQLLHADRYNTSQNRYNLAYDAGSRISSVTMTSAAVGMKQGTFYYDATNQLTGTSGTLNPPESYTYDLAGNRVTSQSGTNTGAYSTQTGNRLASDGQFNYTYDAEGNMLTRTRISDNQVTEYAWDHRNRLTAVEERTSAGVQVSHVTYAYDAFDRRIAKDVSLPPLVQPGPTHDLIGLFATSTRQWLLDLADNGGAPERTWNFVYGDPSTAQNYPVTGDWDGDGKDEIGLWVRTTADWHLDLDGRGGGAERVLDYPTWLPPSSQVLPVVGDWDNDGDDDVGVFNPNTGYWYLELNGYGGNYDVTRYFPGFGGLAANKVPVIGDWDGDGDDNLGVYDRASGTWYLDLNDVGGSAERTLVMGGTGYTPVVGDWDGDGDDDIGTYRTLTGVWSLDFNGLGGAPERILQMGGGTGYLPIVGDWDGAPTVYTPRQSREAYVYDGGHIIIEYRDPDGPGPQPLAPSTRRLYGPVTDQILAEEQYPSTLNPQPSTLFPLTDWQGSVRDLIQFNSSTGQPFNAKHIDYDSFGRIFRVTTGTGQPSTLDSGPSTRLLYTAREYDTETGLQYNRARYYNSQTGRWLSEDPIGFSAGDPNLYRYVGNSAPNGIDPSGLIGDDEQQMRPIALDELRSTARDAKQNVSRYDGPAFVAAQPSWWDRWIGRPLSNLRDRFWMSTIGYRPATHVEDWHEAQERLYGRPFPTAQYRPHFALQGLGGAVEAGIGALAEIPSGTTSTYFVADGSSRFLGSVEFFMTGSRSNSWDIVGRAYAETSQAALGSPAPGQIAREAVPVVLAIRPAFRTAPQSPRQTFATGNEWYEYFAARDGVERVSWTSSSSATSIEWAPELPIPEGDLLLIRVQPRSRTFVRELQSVAGPRPTGTVAHHVKFLQLNGADNGITNGMWIGEPLHINGHARIFSQIHGFEYGTRIVITGEPIGSVSEIFVSGRPSLRFAPWMLFQRPSFRLQNFSQPSAEARPLVAAEFSRSSGDADFESDHHQSTVLSELQLGTGIVIVSVQDPDGVLEADHWERIQDALGTLNGLLVSQGIMLKLGEEETSSGRILLRFSSTSVCGSAADGVLGCESESGVITLITGWSWYVSQDPNNVGPGQYDLQTVLTHELGHALGLSHSHDPDSVMYWKLARGEARRLIGIHNVSVSGDRGGEGIWEHHATPIHLAAQLAPVPKSHGQYCPHCGFLLVNSSTARTPPENVLTNQDASAGQTAPNDMRYVVGGQSWQLAFFLSRENELDASGTPDILLAGDGEDIQVGSSGQDFLIGGVRPATTPSHFAESLFSEFDVKGELMDMLISEIMDT